MNHYETLGIKTDASPDEIKRAYRDRAKQVHPDKGGKQSEFEPVAQAYEVLSNPERRLLYDATGQDRQTPLETSVQQLLSQLFHQALANPNNVPLVKTVREHLKNGLSTIPKEIKAHKDRKKKLEATRGRVTTTAPANVVHILIDAELKLVEQSISESERQAEIGKACLKALETYSEDWKEPELLPHFMISYGAPPTSTTSI